MTDKIKTILEQMTIEEKADMVCGASNFCTADASRYGVPAIRCWMEEPGSIMNS